MMEEQFLETNAKCDLNDGKQRRRKMFMARSMENVKPNLQNKLDGVIELHLGIIHLSIFK